MSGRAEFVVVYPNNRVRAYGALASEVAAVTPPVQVGLVAAYARSRGIDAEIVDAEAENRDPDGTVDRVAARRPRLVCVCTDHLNSGDVTKIGAALETLAALKRRAPEIPVVLEGVVPSAYPERMLREEGADYVCRGEAYAPVVSLVESLRAGARPEPIPGIWRLDGDALVEGGRAPLEDRPDTLPFVPWDMMPPARYRAHNWHCLDDLGRRSPYACVYTNLGCPYACTFCSVNVVAGGPNYRPRSPENVMEEIDFLVRRHGVRNIRIVDNVFNVRQDLSERLCDLIIARGYDLNIWIYSRVETIRDANFLRKMRRAGIRWIAFGIEAASERVRKAVEKGSTPAQIERAIEMTRSAGIWIVGNFIFGLPEDDFETMRATYEMAVRYDFEWVNFYCAMAYPGTALHEQIRASGVDLPREWDAYGQYSPNIRPLATRHVPAAEVVRFRDRAWDEYVGSPRYLSMVERTFGIEAVRHIEAIRKIKLPRRILEEAA